MSHYNEKEGNPIAEKKKENAEEIIIKATPYDYPYNKNFTVENTALIIIDMQIDFCGKGGYVDCMGYDISLTQAPIKPIKNLLELGREIPGFTIIHTREGHDDNLSDLPDNKRWRSKGIGAEIGSEGPMGKILVRNQPGWQIIEELTPLAHEIIIDKPGKGCFYATDLDLILKNKGIKNLILTGITADVCVHTTLREANDRGYECLLVEDATAATEYSNYLAAIHMVKMQGGIFGATATSDKVLTALEALKQKAEAIQSVIPLKETQVLEGDSLPWLPFEVHRKVTYQEILPATVANQIKVNVNAVLRERIEVGGQVLPHYHDVAEVIHIIKGNVKLLLNGVWTSYKAGDTFIVPAEVVHSVANDDVEATEQVSIFIPIINSGVYNTDFKSYLVEGYEQ